jgi:hypothetical protein
VALVNVSCGGSILVESILRENDQQKGFHVAKTRNGHDWAARYPLIIEAVNTSGSGRSRLTGSGVLRRPRPDRLPEAAPQRGFADMSWSPCAVFGLSVIECFETDGGVNYRSERLIIF